MKKSFLFAIMAAAMMVSCGSESKDSKSAENEAESTEESSTATEVDRVASEVVADGGIVYVDLMYIDQHSKIYATEGTAFEKKLAEFQESANKKQSSWATKEQNLANEYNKLQQDALKIQQDYEKGLITSITAQQKGEDLAKKEQSIQQRLNTLQSTIQKESEQLAKEESALLEEQQVITNRFTLLVELAVKNINADGRYKMILNKGVIVDADASLDISNLVLAEMDRLYDEGALN